MQNKYYSWTIALLAVMMTMQVQAQSNILAGYKMAYMQPTGVATLVDQYNAANDVAEPLGPLDFLHGITFGYRYRFGAAALEVSWSNVGASQRAEGFDAMGAAFDKRIGWSITQYDANLQFKAGIFNFGAGAGYRRVKSETDIDGLDATLNLDNSTDWVGNAHFGVEVQSERIAFALLPYVTYPLEPVSIDNLAQDLVPGSPAGLEEDFLTFGLRVVIYNGPQ
jgi:hypothetical protein